MSGAGQLCPCDMPYSLASLNHRIHSAASSSSSKPSCWSWLALQVCQMFWAGQGRAGQGRAGQGRAGQGRALDSTVEHSTAEHGTAEHALAWQVLKSGQNKARHFDSQACTAPVSRQSLLLKGIALFPCPSHQIRVLIVPEPDVGITMIHRILGHLQAPLAPLQDPIRHQAVPPSSHPVCFSFLHTPKSIAQTGSML